MMVLYRPGDLLGKLSWRLLYTDVGGSTMTIQGHLNSGQIDVRNWVWLKYMVFMTLNSLLSLHSFNHAS
jgi:hypothetical protein